jgi:hypothetical protein
MLNGAAQVPPRMRRRFVAHKTAAMIKGGETIAETGVEV